jgi:GT2 family glycosyltransferase
MTDPVVPLARSQRIVVLAAHDGDEWLGAGVLLARLRADGTDVSTLALAGETPLAYGELLVQRVLQAVEAFGPQWVLVPSPLEQDADRRALAMAAVEALRRRGAVHLALYEISTPARPNWSVDISAQLDWKRSQVERLADGPAVLALNAFRGRTAAAPVDAAEAFELLDAATLAGDRWSLFATEHAREAVRGEAIDGRDRPLVSVLIRSMDRASLFDALDSVALQTYPNIEVVVVEACGPGHRRLGERCGRFPLRQVGSGAPLQRAAAANAAMAHARGDWLLFLDDDDQLDAAHIARLRSAVAASPRSRIAYAGVRLVDGQGRCTAVLDEPFDPTRLWCANFLPIHAVMFARALVTAERRFDEALPVYEDWDFWQQLAQHERFLHVPGVSASYRLVGDSGLSAEQDAALAKTWRLAFYRKWLPRLDAAALERVAAQAEHGRGAAREARQVAEQGRLELSTTRSELAGLQHRLEAACLDHAELGRQLAERSAAAARDVERLETAQLALQSHAEALAQQLAAAKRSYEALETGYRQVVGSLSWRVTRPLRAVRSALGRMKPERLLVATLRGVALRLPVSASTRQRVKVRLAASRWTASWLRWLAPPAADPSSGNATAAPTLDKEAVRAAAEASLSAFLDRGDRLFLGAHRDAPGRRPRVSVIVVLYNQAGLSLACLEALAALQAPDFELLIVDNASSDRVPRLLDRVEGATILRQAENLGFLRAVNLAAREARGDYLLLLNNDAVVFDDTLVNAVERLDADADVGAVGGPILLWDGRLQEAGSIIWRDGSCLGYGRGESPDAGPYRYLRDVDYCSGAFLMVRRALFETLGGFDERFAPAYYEESDLCIRLWEAGHRVVCDPRVRVRHFEFASDAGSGRALMLQARNRERLVAKHAAFLAAQQLPGVERLLWARERLAAGARRVLFIDDRVPLPWLGQAYPRAASLVAAVAQGRAFVTHYPLQFPHEAWEDVYRALPPRCEVMLGAGLAGIARFLEQRAGFYDVLLVSRPHNMAVVRAIRERHPDWFASSRIVYDAEALFSLRDIAKASVLGRPLDTAAQQVAIEAEMALARGADAIVTVSEVEARHFRAAGHDQVHVLGHAIAAKPGASRFDQRRGFLFVGAIGADDTPNTDSLLWFVRECWPSMAAALGPQAGLDIVGPCDSARVRGMASSSIRVHGRVDDLGPFYESARVFIVPTRFAAGIPHKAHEAAARGLPIVASTLIAEQLAWGDAVPAAGDAAAFAHACLRLHHDAAAWSRHRAMVLEAVARDCDPQTFRATVDRIVGHATPRASAAESKARVVA